MRQYKATFLRTDRPLHGHDVHCCCFPSDLDETQIFNADLSFNSQPSLSWNTEQSRGNNAKNDSCYPVVMDPFPKR